MRRLALTRMSTRSKASTVADSRLAMVSFSRQVAGEHADRPFGAGFVADLGLQPVFVDIGEHHIGALVDEVARDGETDASGGAGHDGGLAGDGKAT